MDVCRLARALVLGPEIVLFDEPDSGLDPVRTAYLNQLIVDLNRAEPHGSRSSVRGAQNAPRAGRSGAAGGSSPSGAPGQGAGSTTTRPVHVAGYGKDSWTWSLIGPLAG